MQSITVPQFFGPIMTDYISLQKRINSFSDCVNLEINSRCYAEAGFFYSKSLNLIQCYSCGLLLTSFESDNPWNEHAKKETNCPHFYLNRGCELAVQKRNLHESSSCNEIEPHLKCLSCSINKKEIGFHPCEHIVVCSLCAASFYRCPHCGRKIYFALRVRIV